MSLLRAQRRLAAGFTPLYRFLSWRLFNAVGFCLRATRGRIASIARGCLLGAIDLGLPGRLGRPFTF